MKYLAVSVLIAAAAWTQAQDRLIVRLQDNANAYSVANAHNVTYVDRTLDGPFAYYQTKVGSVKATVVADLLTDPRVIWVEDDQTLESPENQSGGKGSTVSVVNDRNT